MCMMVYLASDDPLPTIAWDEKRPAFNVRGLEEFGWGAGVVKQFTKPNLYYLGSYQGCSCGFGDSSEQGNACLHALRNYLIAATAHSRTVEMWSCWAGDEGAEKLSEAVISPEALLDHQFHFAEQEYLRVVSSTVNPSIALR